jgi:pimeloyl-ACP methyl ester carboxylesterase
MLYGHAAVSSALSPAITVDTRNSSELIPLTTTLTAKKSKQGHTLVRRHSPEIGIVRNTDQPAYLVLEIPRFDSKGGGWAPRTKGLGTFHGFEIIYQGNSNDRIYQKIGGTPPSSSTPESEWKLVSANRILSGQVRRETRYFKIVFADGGKESARFSVRYHSARFTDPNGSPVTKLDPNNNIWLVFHDKNSGHATVSSLHNALRKARRKDQIVTVDWASAATTGADWKQPASNASYFRNIGQNMAQLLKQQGFTRQQIHLVGHGWGAVVAHETASSLGGSNHIISLDPTAHGAGAFDTRSVRLSRISNIATAITSGSSKQGTIGNESIATTADFSIRLLSQSHSGDSENAAFHHALPVHWCIQALTSTDGPYWPFLGKEILLRNKTQPELPWSATDTLTGGFHLECLGHTQYDKSGSTPDAMATMDKITSLAFLRNKQRTVARAKLTQDGTTTWTYRRK